jgi:lipoprotein signal peptidase
MKIVAQISGLPHYGEMLESQSHPPISFRVLSPLERRRPFRSWVPVFQVSMVLFFADQILRTYCATNLPVGVTQPLFGQSILQLAHFPDGGILGKIAALFPQGWQSSLPKISALGTVLIALLGLAIRLNKALFGELLLFGIFLSGAFSNWVSRSFAARNFNTLVLDWSETYAYAFNVSDVCVFIGVIFLLRLFLKRHFLHG